mmetsp:Transcript_11303/g.16734  ORF Transcript_11303/g.16734 Transcript_11303/m.16734 type:complete len:741 (+) Transcript_11303:56-2278(+)|eukprot:CAMPEP_0117424776 /NCGR_PEP_ID=MMETSP0758-20121206/5145_1 /TAXON_ID=63605 /ORGANISM="Percolomonas cosmopolitus, Strain AE-1 (ATCC 50343)" /LENGTH=740 /DNA_ID=CAMNT_0005208793 /DNA_START=53 /DNA_END=2275 /DNA_ORIENTATION=-
MARTKQTARKVPRRAFGGRKIKRTITAQGIKKQVLEMEDYEHISLEDFIKEIFEEEEDKEVGVRIYETLKHNYLNSMEQMLEINHGEYSMLGLPLGLKMKLKNAIDKYCNDVISKMNRLEDNQFFYVKRTRKGEEEEEVKVVIKNTELKKTIRGYLNDDELYKPEPEMELEKLMRLIPQLEGKYGYKAEDPEIVELIKEEMEQKMNVATQNNYQPFGTNMGYNQYGEPTNGGTEFDEHVPEHHLLKFLHTEVPNYLNNLNEMVGRGKITFDALWYIFYKKVMLVALDKKKRKFLEGYECTASNYSGGYQSQFVVNGKNMISNGQMFSFGSNTSFSIEEYKGERDITTLDVAPLKEEGEQYKHLKTRGERYAKMALGHSYLQYKGMMTRKRYWTNVEEKATGRVMVDIAAFNKMSNQTSTSKKSGFGGQSLHQALNKSMDNCFDELPEKFYWMCPAAIQAFSFLNKRWGYVDLEGLEPIQYRSKAFDLLVLDQHKKDVIQALVTHSDKAFSDIIEHKGKGCIFLLHGPPGVGKTLTAEAIAEYLERPLYAVSVGELGTEPETLESNLSEILELAGIWNAVVLVDEADIFLERRSETDIIRNAMVGVFLRVIEYFKGVLFLTSNRVSSLDRAFHSRVSVALKYPELNAKSRMKIWEHFLHATQMKVDTNVNLEKLGAYELNGRQIRSTVRLANSLAMNEAVAKSTEPVLNMRHITQCVSISNQFADFVASSYIAEMMQDEEK